MANKNPCGECKFMWPLQKGKRGGMVQKLARGYCLKRTIFPKNRPGKHVYPPGAIIKDTEHDRLKPYIVRKDQIVQHCTFFTNKE